MKNVLALVVVSLSFVACTSSSSSSDTPPSTGSGGASASGGAGGIAVSNGGSGGGAVSNGGSTGSGGSGAGGVVGTDGGVAVLSGTVCGNLQLVGMQTIPAGQTVTLCAGTVLTATTAQAGIAVLGTLNVQGAADGPVILRAAGSPNGWTGLDIQRGGTVTATYLEIHDATVGLSARAGAAFNIDHLVIDNSSQLLVLASNGTLSHGALHGLGVNQSNSPVYIDTASPMITNTVVDQGNYGAVDSIVVGGAASAPVFDQMEVADAHCAFHFNQGTGITISNSFIHHNSYGLMVVNSTDGHVVHNNFEDESINIGSCGATSAEVKDNFFQNGVAFGDGSCTTLMVTGTAPPMAYTTGVGPTP